MGVPRERREEKEQESIQRKIGWKPSKVNEKHYTCTRSSMNSERDDFTGKFYHLNN